MTGFACAIHAVERKRARLDRRDAHAAIDARHLFRIEPLFPVHDRHENDALRQLDRLLDRSFEPPLDVLLDQQAIDDNFNGVVPLLVEFDRLIQSCAARRRFAREHNPLASP